MIGKPSDIPPLADDPAVAMAEEIRKAAGVMGSIRSPKKAEASRRNGQLGGRPKGTKLSEETRRRIAEGVKAASAQRRAEANANDEGGSHG